MGRLPRKWIVGSLTLVGCAAVSWYVFTPKSGQTVVSDKEQALSRSIRGVSAIRHSDSPPVLESDQVIVTQCYQFTLPEDLTRDPSMERDDDCVRRFSTTTFLGKLVIAATEWSSDLEEHSGVVLRETRDTYQQLDISHPQAEVKIFLSEDDGIVFMLENQLLVTIAVSQHQGSKHEVETLLRTVADSIEIANEAM